MNLLDCIRKHQKIEFMNNVGLKINERINICVESTVINCILKTFNGINMKEQYAVDGYKIDLYIIDYNIAVECDEMHHNYHIESDKIREEYIKSVLNCRFVRVNPFDTQFNIYCLLNEIFSLIHNT